MDGTEPIDLDGESTDPYAVLAPYYRSLISTTGVLDAEISLLLQVLERANIGANARILDMGCGTGDVLGSLFQQNYSQLMGIDASPTMIEQARGTYPHLFFTLQNWKSIGEFFGQHGRFDAIYCLSNSISHLPVTELEVVLSQVRCGLSPKGIFVFDSRQWSESHPHGLRENARPEGAFRWLAEIEIGGRRYWIDDCCEYAGHRQIVLYRIRRRRTSGRGWDEEQFAQVSYAVITIDSWRRLLASAGFGTIEVHLVSHWPYAVLIAGDSTCGQTTQ